MLTRRAGLLDALDVQRHVIGALIMRELHTRYGRDNIGYLWMLLEPLLLAASVAVLHTGSTGGHYGADLKAVPFVIGGYSVFMIFRSAVTRAETALEANKPLLFHRMVTIFDLLLSRVLLEAASSTAALAVLLAGAVALGMADPPSDPMMLLVGIAMMAWFSFAVAMAICAATYFSKAVAKFVHPLVYIIFPLSGALYLMRWIPEPYRGWIQWSPINQIFELVHAAQFRSVDARYVDVGYIVAWCMGLTLLGLLALRVLRARVHLS